MSCSNSPSSAPSRARTPSRSQKRCSTKFGTLAAVLAAPVQRIAEVKGAGPAVAQDLKTAQALLERAARAS